MPLSAKSGGNIETNPGGGAPPNPSAPPPVKKSSGGGSKKAAPAAAAAAPAAAPAEVPVDVEAIKAKYPAYAFLLDDPELGPLLRDGVRFSYDDATFQAKLRATNWWKNNSEAQRAWYATLNTDPSQANALKGTFKNQVNTLAAKAGVSLSDADLEWFASTFLPLGYQPNDARIMEAIWQVYSQKPGQRTAGGDITAATEQVRALAEHDYMLDMGQADIDAWAHGISTGTATIDGLKSSLQVLSKGRYSAYADLIDQGLTPGQIFAPYKASIANELEYGSAEQVDLLHDPRWSQVTGKVDADGKLRPFTLSETLQLARSQDEWKGTRNGQALGAQLTQSLLKTFGEM